MNDGSSEQSRRDREGPDLNMINPESYLVPRGPGIEEISVDACQHTNARVQICCRSSFLGMLAVVAGVADSIGDILRRCGLCVLIETCATYFWRNFQWL